MTHLVPLITGQEACKDFGSNAPAGVMEWKSSAESSHQVNSQAGTGCQLAKLDVSCTEISGGFQAHLADCSKQVT
jgi:hypothetical protein